MRIKSEASLAYFPWNDSHWSHEFLLTLFVYVFMFDYLWRAKFTVVKIPKEVYDWKVYSHHGISKVTNEFIKLKWIPCSNALE